MDWRLVGLALIVGVGAPGGAVMGDLPVAARVALAAIGELTWWYLFRCVTDTWHGRAPGRGADSHCPVTPWMIFSLTFYSHALFLGHAWRNCQPQTSGYALIHVLVSAALAGSAAVLAWAATVHTRNGRVRDGTVQTERRGAMLAVLSALLVALVLLWPAAAVWHGIAGSAGTSCGGASVPWGVPSW